MVGTNQRNAKGGFDLHETPPEAVRALLRIEQVPQRLWDPACGPGAMVRELRASGRGVWASDVVNYAWGQDHIGTFFDWTLAPPLTEAIVMNPPYKHAAAFVSQALSLAPEVYALLRFNWVAARRQRYPHIYDRLARVHVFSRRLPLMHRADWHGPLANSQFDHAWMVWEARPAQSITMTRLDWKET